MQTRTLTVCTVTAALLVSGIASADLSAAEMSQGIEFSRIAKDAVDTKAATKVHANGAQLNASLPPCKSCEAQFRYRRVGDSLWRFVRSSSSSHTNRWELNKPIENLNSNTRYEFYARIKKDKKWKDGASKYFTTPGAGRVDTLPATSVTSTTATLEGWVDAKPDTDIAFFWASKETPGYDRLLSAVPDEVTKENGNTRIRVSWPTSSLAPNTTYRYYVRIRVPVFGGQKIFRSKILSFTTLAAPSPTPSGGGDGGGGGDF